MVDRDGYDYRSTAAALGIPMGTLGVAFVCRARCPAARARRRGGTVMTRDDTRDALPEERDLRVGSVLGELDVPDYPPDFLASVWARIDEDSWGEADGGHGPRRVAATGPGGPGARSWVGAAAALAAALAAVALFGVPGAGDRAGPPPVSAAAVVRIAETALAAGRTLTADCTSRWMLLLDLVSPDAAPSAGESDRQALSPGAARRRQLPGDRRSADTGRRRSA